MRMIGGEIAAKGDLRRLKSLFEVSNQVSNDDFSENILFF